MQKLRLGISTCPNDTFIYEALVQGLIHSEFAWEVTFADVQTLNEMVLAGNLDVAKVSCGVLPQIQSNYRLLSCGGAMGYGCGPLLLSSRKSASFDPASKTFLPGKNTTAAALFFFWFATTQGGRRPIVSYAFFDEIYQKLLSGQCFQGVVIHEKRFTWEQDDLKSLVDLGAFWEAETRSPIPLGCTVAKKNLESPGILAVENEIRRSLDFAWKRPNLVSDFIRKKAQIADNSVIEKHIRMFVTEFTRDIGSDGERSLDYLMKHLTV
ncbi:1,4-dihydroxy-6-naphthoate synthase [Fibrobacter intestinalis]|uniref:1,4-dihydroxy-6-naphthoate synthase n=1 Tax=Fibrobacter intestinalis TaxID=28122 RepID=A0A1T4LLG2_9BACT|nr:MULTISPECIES: 1,4-dihydroxy-6-naphthoate synthase [Fibrobacter]PBC73918.1 1,4-dihydroxy-6-naphthoate synthase [Fibrobacter sp. NR9]SJZ55570.1 1,4-dihydroxy-6-naphthoate synthase [Fibrobacter intestinalis]